MAIFSLKLILIILGFFKKLKKKKNFFLGAGSHQATPQSMCVSVCWTRGGGGGGGGGEHLQNCFPFLIMEFFFATTKEDIVIIDLAYTSENQKHFFEIKMVSRDDMSAKSAETRIL